jgi:hypothetical protein
MKTENTRRSNSNKWRGKRAGPDTLRKDVDRRVAHDAAAMLLVLWIDQLAAKHLEAGERALLVRTHQPAIAGNIGDENSGELAFGLI